MGGAVFEHHVRLDDPAVSVCHLALLIEAIAFMQTNVTRLRILEVVSRTMIAGYSLYHSGGNWLDCHVIWSVFHIMINLVSLSKLAMKYRQAENDMTVQEREVRIEYFEKFNVLQFAAVRQRWHWHVAKENEVLMTRGETAEYLQMIYAGICRVKFDHENEAMVGRGQFLGETIFFTGEAAPATVIAGEGAILIRWNMHEVRKLASSKGISDEITAFQKFPSLFVRQLAGTARTLSIKMVQERKRYSPRDFGRPDVASTPRDAWEDDNVVSWGLGGGLMDKKNQVNKFLQQHDLPGPKRAQAWAIRSSRIACQVKKKMFNQKSRTSAYVLPVEDSTKGKIPESIGSDTKQSNHQQESFENKDAPAFCTIPDFPTNAAPQVPVASNMQQQSELQDPLAGATQVEDYVEPSGSVPKPQLSKPGEKVTRILSGTSPDIPGTPSAPAPTNSLSSSSYNVRQLVSTIYKHFSPDFVSRRLSAGLTSKLPLVDGATTSRTGRATTRRATDTVTKRNTYKRRSSSQDYESWENENATGAGPPTSNTCAHRRRASSPADAGFSNRML